MIVVTGASGQLGRLVIEALRKRVSSSEIVAMVRNPSKMADIQARGIAVREADYRKPEALKRAFDGASKVLLISGSELGKRVAQHCNVIEAAKAANVESLYYTSILHADSSPLQLAAEHRDTEAAIRDSGLAFTLLRHGWYTENYTGNLAHALQHGKLFGCAGEGRISGAARVDYAEAAAEALVNDEHIGKTFELAGDEGFTLADLAAEIHEQAGNPMVYENLPEPAYRDLLVQAGLPPSIAGMLADTETCISRGALYDDSRQLSALIGRPTTQLSTLVVRALNSLGE